MGLITSRCSRKEPALLSSSRGGTQTGLERAAEIEPREERVQDNACKLCAFKLSWTRCSPVSFQPLYRAGRESSRSGLCRYWLKGSVTQNSDQATLHKDIVPASGTANIYSVAPQFD